MSNNKDPKSGYSDSKYNFNIFKSQKNNIKGPQGFEKLNYTKRSDALVLYRLRNVGRLRIGGIKKVAG